MQAGRAKVQVLQCLFAAAHPTLHTLDLCPARLPKHHRSGPNLPQLHGKIPKSHAAVFFVWLELAFLSRVELSCWF